MSKHPLILASASPRRRDLLDGLGLRFVAVPADIDETPRAGEAPEDLVTRLAAEKAAAVPAAAGQVVIGADTEVVVDGEVLGKPAGEADALAMLARLSGRRHRVLSGVAVRCDGATRSAMSCTMVGFREIRPDEARRYWHSGEPAGKAGSYAIQGLGGAFVETLEGSYSGVVGLPVFELAALLREAGIDILPELAAET